MNAASLLKFRAQQEATKSARQAIRNSLELPGDKRAREAAEESAKQWREYQGRLNAQ